CQSAFHSLSSSIAFWLHESVRQRTSAQNTAPRAQRVAIEETRMSDPLAPGPGENRILAALPINERARLIDDLELVTLPLGHVLYEPGDVLGFVYFPTSCIVSLVFTTENGATAELAMTGKDGLVGIPLVLGGQGAWMAFVYFPTSCIVSLVFTTESGATAELAMTGKDGLVGIPLVLGGRTSTHKAVVQCAGTAWRLRAEVMAWELNQHGHL